MMPMPQTRVAMKLRFLPLLLAVLLGAAAPAVARDDDGRGPGWGERRELAPDERREMRRQMREHWRQERPPRGDGEMRGPGRERRELAPDERREMRRQMREHWHGAEADEYRRPRGDMRDPRGRVAADDPRNSRRD